MIGRKRESHMTPWSIKTSTVTKWKDDMRYLRQPLVLLAVIFMSACGQNNLIFQIVYDDVDGLTKGAPLVYGESIIGTVEAIQYTDEGKFMVGVNVNEPSRTLATHSALFYISDAQGSDNKVLELVDSSEEEGSLILEGQIVKGSSKVSGMTQKLQNQFGDALQLFSDNVKGSWVDWKEQTLDQQMAYLEKELDRILLELEDFSASTRKQIETTVIPELNKQIEALRETLEEFGREHELDDIEKKMNDINELIAV